MKEKVSQTDLSSSVDSLLKDDKELRDILLSLFVSSGVKECKSKK